MSEPTLKDLIVRSVGMSQEGVDLNAISTAAMDLTNIQFANNHTRIPTSQEVQEAYTTHYNFLIKHTLGLLDCYEEAGRELGELE